MNRFLFPQFNILEFQINTSWIIGKGKTHISTLKKSNVKDSKSFFF